MSPQSDHDPGTLDLALSKRLAAMRRHFIAAWQAALRGAVPPSIDTFLTGMQEPERSTLRQVLEQVDNDYRSGRTIDQRPASDPSAATVDTPAQTTTSVPGGATVDLPSSASSGTLEFAHDAGAS